MCDTKYFVVCFQLFDRNQDGFVDRDELRAMLTSMYALLCDEKPNADNANGNTANECSDFTNEVSFFVDMLFEMADTNRDGVLSNVEFREAAMLQPFILKTFNLTNVEQKRKVHISVGPSA